MTHLMRPPARPEIETLPEYRLRHPAGACVKLNQHESPFDLPEELKREVLEALARAPWIRYPPVRPDCLCAPLADWSGGAPDQVILTNGSTRRS